jgi:hypothetical protein
MDRLWRTRALEDEHHGHIDPIAGMITLSAVASFFAAASFIAQFFGQ